MKSLLKNSRQSFITRVSYGMKNVVVLPEDSNSRSRGFNKPAKNFFFLTKIKFAAAKINQTISLSPDNASYQSSFSIVFVHVVKVPWHIVRSETKFTRGLSFSNRWVLGSDLGYQTWWQAHWPAEPSFWP